MITANFEDYPEHRLKFFSLLRAIATHCFPALIRLSGEVCVELYFALVYCINQVMCSASLFLANRSDFGTPQQLKLVMDSIIWAFRHTERNIAETGLNLLLEMLKNFQVHLFVHCCLTLI